MRVVLKKKIREQDIKKGTSELETADGKMIRIENEGKDKIKINGKSKVIMDSIAASNGIIHVVDTVIQKAEIGNIICFE